MPNNRPIEPQIFTPILTINQLKEKLLELGGSIFAKNKVYIKHVLYFLDNTLDSKNMGIGEALYFFRNDLKEYPKCKCGNVLKYNRTACKFNTYCSCKCIEKNKKALKNRQETCINRYGETNVFKSKMIKQKIIDINIKKYGESHYNKTQEYKNRIKNGNIKTNHNKDIHRNARLNYAYSSFSKFNNLTKPEFGIEEFIGGGPGKHYKWKCQRCNAIYYNYYNRQKDHWPKCPTCDCKHTDLEKFIVEILNKNNIDFTYRNRKILEKNYEIDFFIPSYNIGIEVNGLYFHSEKNGILKDYHLNKTSECASKNIKLIQIFADEIYNKKNIVRSRILHALKLVKTSIHARKCEIKPIDSLICSKFLNKYHIQGNDKSQIKLGAFYKNRLISVMTFCKLRNALGYKNKSTNVWELSRFCSIFHFNTVGIAGKLLKWFELNFIPAEIISYADRRWSNLLGKTVYEKIGFKYIKSTTPNYFYTKDYTHRLHRFNFQKHLLSKKLKMFDNALSENKNMINEGYTRIWDCGSYKFSKTFSRTYNDRNPTI